MVIYIAIQDATVASLIETYLAAQNVRAIRVPCDALGNELLARSHSPAVIVADLPPDRQDRIRLCRWLRNASLTHGANVILLHDQEQSSALRYATGAQAVLAKPFALSDLTRAVARLADPPEVHPLHVAAYAG